MRDNAALIEPTARGLPWKRPWLALRLPATALLVAAAYYLCVGLGFAFVLPGSTYSPLWPPIAILLAALLLTPVNTWWLWLLATTCAHLAYYVPLGRPLWHQWIQVAHGFVMVLTPALLLRRYAPDAARLATFNGVLAFLIAVVGTALLVPLASAAVYVAAGLSDSYRLIWQLLAWSNVLAYLTLLPCILVIVQYGREWMHQATVPRAIEAGLLAVLVAAVTELVFGAIPAGPASSTYIRAATLPLLLWAAVRFGPSGVSLAVTAMTLLALWNASLGYGPFTAAEPTQNVLNVQSYFLTFAAPLMLLAALMADRRKDAEELRRLNTRLENRVTERTAELEHANRQFAVARDQAESANRAKSDFLAIMSHELRTPMNAVIGMTSLLLTTPLTRAQRDDVETIAYSGNMLLTLINDVLDYSKIDANKLTLEYHPFALRACVEEALDLLAPLADAKHLVLHYSPDPALPDEYVGDPARLRQVLVNLLSNAFALPSAARSR